MERAVGGKNCPTEIGTAPAASHIVRVRGGLLAWSFAWVIIPVIIRSVWASRAGGHLVGVHALPGVWPRHRTGTGPGKSSVTESNRVEGA